MRKGVVLVAALATGTGCLIVLMAVDAITLGEGSRQAERWPIILAGLAFVMAGVLTVLVELMRLENKMHLGAASLVSILRTLTGLLLVLIFITLGNWVAFGPGDRDIQQALTEPLFAPSPENGNAIGRAAFGVSAVALDLILLYGLVAMLLRRTRRSISDN
jgi:O-antigen/teichoic acid export membrane protein